MVGCARVAPELITPERTHAQRNMSPSLIKGNPHPLMPSSADPPPPRLFQPPREREDDGSRDLYGNDITDAVAKYKLDSDGSLYELHSPQTQLPRLGSPKG